MGIAYNTSIVRNGLVLHLDAANRKSYPGTGTVWTDLSGKSNNGTLTNGPVYSNGILTFDGTNDTVVLPDIANIRLVDTTFEFIFKLDTTSSDRVILNKGTHTTNTPILVWFDVLVGSGDLGVGNVNCISVQYFDGSIKHWISTDSNTIQANKYYMLTVVGKKTTGQLSIYLNGILSKTNNKAWNGIQNTTSNFRLGSGGAGENPFDGELNYFAAYTKALSATEIQQNFNALRGRYGI